MEAEPQSIPNPQSSTLCSSFATSSPSYQGHSAPHAPRITLTSPTTTRSPSWRACAPLSHASVPPLLEPRPGAGFEYSTQRSALTPRQCYEPQGEGHPLDTAA
ncbi:hypothetical protein E2562_017734 [Oryza meyeriana var. granulata]|uniref:Uncharacterized protein n=1 Tax=Oryza meyeriana var. granulata TaxID=110450 RepID=A0A6G1BYC4_9ORYZ|nr:hypothetical protein E2562_017734 [Oryza meyeriana var. granulata]